MNRPPKKNKQSKDGLLKDPRFSPEELARARSAKADAAGDDRNLVSIDDELANVELADRLWLLWSRHGGKVLAVIVAALAIVLGYFASHYLQQRAVGSMQEAYVKALGNPAELEAFANDHSGKPLGGVAYVELADKAYAAGDFANAAVLYAKARPALAQTVLQSRAQLGEGISLLKAGKSEEARKLLGQLVENTAALGAVRGQAAFDLVVLEFGENRTDAAKAWLQRIGEIPGAGIWAEQAAGYAAQRGLSL